MDSRKPLCYAPHMLNDSLFDFVMGRQDLAGARAEYLDLSILVFVGLTIPIRIVHKCVAKGDLFLPHPAPTSTLR